VGFYIPEDVILHSHEHVTLKSYMYSLVLNFPIAFIFVHIFYMLIHCPSVTCFVRGLNTSSV
jgi:hypothetical protein